MRVLMIEDDEDYYVLFRDYLPEASDFKIDWCKTFTEGMAFLENNAIDIILLDLSLPDGQGLGMLDNLLARFPRQPVVILTGWDDDDQAIEAVRRGAQDYLIKGQIGAELLRRSLSYAVERKHIQQQLHDEHNLLRTLIDSLPDYVFIKDADLRLVMSNQAHARMAGKTPSELVGKTAYDIFPVEMAAGFHADDQQILDTGEAIFNRERTSVNENGEPITLLITKVPLHDVDGNITGMVSISRDISDRKQFEQTSLELSTERERMKVLQHFIRDMSHDLRTPLTALNNGLYLLQRAQDPEKHLAQIEKMEAQMLRLDKLLNESLQMAHFDQSDMHLNFEISDIHNILEPLVQEYEGIAAAKEITLHYQPESASPGVFIDIVEVARAIICILENAINFTPEGGSIVVRTACPDKNVVISIEDTGPGIAPQSLPRIFERFYRADNARSTTTGGHGLGLSIAQRIIEAHNGRITVNSVLDEGSIFSIQLPTTT